MTLVRGGWNMPYEHVLFVRPPFKKTQQRPLDGPLYLASQTTTQLPLRRKPLSNFKEVNTHSTKFRGLVDRSSSVLFRAKGVFPFEFFPDSIIIDSHKVNIIHNMFFF